MGKNDLHEDGAIPKTGKTLLPFWLVSNNFIRVMLILAVLAALAMWWKPWKKEEPTSHQSANQSGSSNTLNQSGRDTIISNGAPTYNFNGGNNQIGNSNTQYINQPQEATVMGTWVFSQNLDSNGIWITQIQTHVAYPPPPPFSLHWDVSPGITTISKSDGGGTDTHFIDGKVIPAVMYMITFKSTNKMTTNDVTFSIRKFKKQQN
jgi:hypothetical protein